MPRKDPPKDFLRLFAEKLFRIAAHSHFCLEMLAGEFGLKDVRTLRRWVMEYTNLGLYEYCVHVRIQEAARRLRDTDDSVEKIRAQLGMGRDQFLSQFKEEFGCTPSGYRMKWQQPARFLRKAPLGFAFYPTCSN